ncbi:putative glutathione S-transferase [Penicillium brasilianum]|uniref:Cofilin n=1 Tax=Penicillium brasilianum TaxID=104259 RepID=A0A1S9RJC7_PENBI|nr:putative glutathione S-transferase [Penicillium brasilianum]
MASPKIILYTNRGCPWAHRAHIILKELGLEYEEVTIDLSVPREPWYLEVNPRGLVPSLSYNGNIITESGIVAQFLADAHPSHLLPASGPAENALYRARLSFFVDAFFSKVIPHFFTSLRSTSDADRDAAVELLVAGIVKEVEPLLADTEGKGPFFGGSDKLTLAEVLSGSFLLRILGLSKPEYGLVSAKLPALLEQQAPRFKRWAEATIAHESVNYIWDEKAVAERMRARFAAQNVSVQDECLTAFNEFRLSKGKTKYIIYKISDNKKDVVVDAVGHDQDYEVFREQLAASKDSQGRPAPRYAVYDVEYDLGGGEGKRSKIIFISWVPSDTPTLWSMIYASTREVLKNALNLSASIHADDKSDIEWKTVLFEASGGKAGK